MVIPNTQSEMGAIFSIEVCKIFVFSNQGFVNQSKSSFPL
jgi:hypothetical protein